MAKLWAKSAEYASHALKKFDNSLTVSADDGIITNTMLPNANFLHC